MGTASEKDVVVELIENANDRDLERGSETSSDIRKNEEGGIIEDETRPDELIVDANFLGENSNLKVAKDGTTVLIPQPSDDPNDPLNWSLRKKYGVMFMVCFTSTVPDLCSGIGGAILEAQAADWNIGSNVVAHASSGNVFMLGAGGVLACQASAYFGRLPVVFWTFLLAVATIIYCAVAPNYENFLAARILNGTFSTSVQCCGLMFVKDMFFFHEHARVINFWDACVILSPYMGPFLGGFILSGTGNWRWTFGVCSIMTGIAFFLVIFFGDETYYDRNIPMEKQPDLGTRFERLIGISQWRSRHLRNSLWSALTRILVVSKMPVMIFSSIFYMLTFCWPVGINVTLAMFLLPPKPDGYGFSNNQYSLFYLTPMIGAVLGQIFGHFFNDWIAKRYVKKHKGHFEPEVRLWSTYIGTALHVVGLVIVGFSLEHIYSWGVLALGWGALLVGVMINTAALFAYCLDCYPKASSEINGILILWRTISGFVISYVQVDWSNKVGSKWSFSTQGIICAFAFFAFLLPLQYWGKTWRSIPAGQLKLKTY